MIQHTHPRAGRPERVAITVRASLELARCAAQLLAWVTSEADGRMLAEAMVKALDDVLMALER